MGIKTVPHPPYSPDHTPVTFAYSLSSEAVVNRQLRRWKRLWRRSLTRSHKRTSMGPSRSCCNGTTSALQPEEITSKGTRVSCVYNQKLPIRKESGNLSYAPRTSLRRNCSLQRCSQSILQRKPTKLCKQKITLKSLHGLIRLKTQSTKT